MNLTWGCLQVVWSCKAPGSGPGHTLPKEVVQMARKATFIPDTTGPTFVPLDAIPQDVKDLVEEMLKATENGGGRTRLAYDSDDELAKDFKLMASYAAQRKAGILRIRKSPTRDLPENTMDVRVTKDVAANGHREGAANSRRNS